MIRKATIPKLLEVYRFIEAWTAEYNEPPPIKVVAINKPASTNTVWVWYNLMVDLRMIERTRSGKPHLLPLDQADERVQEAMRNENR